MGWIKAWADSLAIILAMHLAPHASAEEENRFWQDEIIYFIMVDRFHNGDTSNDYAVDPHNPGSYHGGDFAGIAEKLDEIKDMGFTAIWLTPIFDNENGGYHGYWINDFYNTEEHFGTLEEFKALVQEAHERDIKVILDFVVNHVGVNHPWQNDPNKESWFHPAKEVVRWNSIRDLENGWIYGLPDLAQENPDVKKYLMDAAKWWIEETDIDGYRLDTVKHVPVEFWKEFSKEVKSVKKDFFLLGEVWFERPEQIARYDETGIDVFADFPLNKPLRDVFYKPDRSLASLFGMWEKNKEVYRNPELLGAFIDNHDMKRFVSGMPADEEKRAVRWKLALAYLYGQPEIPIIYYGSEIAMDGADDPDNRRMMEFNIDHEVRGYIAKLGAIRQKEKALTRGTMKLLHEAEGMAVFKREYKGETVVVAINNSSERREVSLPTAELGNREVLRSLLAMGDIKQAKGNIQISLEAESADMYKAEDAPRSFIAVSAIVMAAVLFMLFIFWRRGFSLSSLWRKDRV
ncbi:MAG TPA: alpha-amylase family glycosyl hydrolase [Bacillaceae bacterium]